MSASAIEFATTAARIWTPITIPGFHELFNTSVDPTDARNGRAPIRLRKNPDPGGNQLEESAA